MNVTEANRARHLVIHLDRGDELPASLLRALNDHEARAGWISGVGSLESAELGVEGPDGRELRRRLDTPSAVVALSGNVAVEGGALDVRLSVTLARETELGLTLAGGTLLAARARSLDLHVTVFDDLQLQRSADERGTSTLTGKKHSSVLSAEPARAPVIEARYPVTEARAPEPRAPEPVRAPEPARAPVVIPAARGSEPRAAAVPVYPPVAPSAQMPPGGGNIPTKLVKPKEDIDDIYPEVGDLVHHFAFGDCTVIASNGDQISLRVEPDGRVRAVALAMLKIEPQPDGPDGKRRFKLARKN
jgi:hypothetical protein